MQDAIIIYEARCLYEMGIAPSGEIVFDHDGRCTSDSQNLKEAARDAVGV